MAEKLLTVSVAAYNVEQYIDDLLSSCVVPSISQLEVIIVDDGGTDSTMDIAQVYSDHYPDVFRLVKKNNEGYGSTINESLKIARGTYFRFLDGDDRFESAALERLIHALSERTEDIVYTPYVRFNATTGDTNLRDGLHDVIEGSYPIATVPADACIAAHSLTYRTQMLLANGFEMLTQRFYTDIEYAYYPFTWADSIWVSHDPLYMYRVGRDGQSVSREGVIAHYRDLVYVVERMLSEVMGPGSSPRNCKMQDYLEHCLSREVCNAIRFLLIAASDHETKQEIIQFDAYVRQYPAIFSRSTQLSKRVALLRGTHYLLYPLCARI